VLQLVVYACWYGAKTSLLTQVDICCFDKTGTLTSDNMVLEGLTGLTGKGEELVTDMKQAGEEVVRVLASCQALIQVDGKFVGDPLEKASFTAVGKPHKSQHKCELLWNGLTLDEELSSPLGFDCTIGWWLACKSVTIARHSHCHHMSVIHPTLPCNS